MFHSVPVFHSLLSTAWAKAKVLLAATPTYLVALATGLTMAAGTIGDAAPDRWQTAAAWALRVAAWLGSAAAIIRRVTPVPADERGLLPKQAPVS